MADTAIEDLTELTSPDTGGGDVLPIVDDPSGSPVTKYITSRNLMKASLTFEQWIFAKDFISRTTNGAAIADRELATNDIMIKTAAFDTTTSEGIGFWWHPKHTWDASTVTFAVAWTNASGGAAETIDFDLAGRSYADDDAIDQALGTAQNVTDTWTAQNDYQISAFSSAITLAGTPADGQANYFQLSRDTAADNLTGDAEIIAVILRYGITDIGA